MHFDASGIIHAWDNYPIVNFPPFWDWIAEKIKNGDFAICDVAFDEVNHKTPDCSDWLKNKGIRKIGLTDNVLVTASAIKNSLGIIADGYHPRGVDENDLIIIANAFVESDMLLTEESRQPALPTPMSRYKIPAVCGLPTVSVTCQNVVELIRSSGAVFK